MLDSSSCFLHISCVIYAVMLTSSCPTGKWRSHATPKLNHGQLQSPAAAGYVYVWVTPRPSGESEGALGGSG